MRLALQYQVLRDTQDTLGSNATRITGSIIKQDSYPTGSLITIAGDLTLERDQSDTTLTLISDGSNPTPGGEQHNPSIKFIQDGGAQNAAVGFNIIDDTCRRHITWQLAIDFGLSMQWMISVGEGWHNIRYRSGRRMG